MARSATQGWLSENGLTAYPLAEDTDLTFVSTIAPSLSFKLPTDLLLDAVFTAPVEIVEDVALGDIFLDPVGQLVTFTLWEPNTGEQLPTITVALASFGVRESFTANFSATLPAYDLAIPVFAGRLIIGKRGFQQLLGSPPSPYAPVNTYLPFEASTVKDNPLAKVKTLGDGVIPLNGDVPLCEGYNVEITRIPEQNGFRIDAYPGAGLGKYCGIACFEPSVCNHAISNINGIGPDSSNFLHMLAIGAVSFRRDETDPHALIISTSVNPTTLCERTGIFGKPGAAGPAGARGVRGSDLDPAHCVCACPSCEFCDTCEVGDGGATCTTCEVCDVVQGFCPQCEHCDAAQCAAFECGVGDGFGCVICDGTVECGLQDFCGQSELAGCGPLMEHDEFYGFNPQDPPAPVTSAPPDRSRGRSLLLPGCDIPLVGDTGTPLPALEGITEACACTYMLFGIVTDITEEGVSFKILDELGSPILVSGELLIVTVSPLVDIGEFQIGDTILVQAFGENLLSAVFQVFPLG